MIYMQSIGNTIKTRFVKGSKFVASCLGNACFNKHNSEMVKFKNSKISYDVSNRDYQKLIDEKYYPMDFLDIDSLKNKKVLDVGSGRGAFVRALKKKGIDIIGIDKSLEKDVVYDESVICANAQSMPFKQDLFDFIYSTWSILTYSSESKEIKLNVIKEMTRVLKPNGRIRLSPIEPTKIIKLIKKNNLPLKVTYLNPEYADVIELTKI